MWRKRLGTFLRLGFAAVAVWALTRMVHGSDVERALRLIQQVGWPLALALVPTLAAMMLDARAWGALVSILGHSVPWRRMLELRVSVEAIVLALPGGSLAGEAAKVALLQRRGGVPVAAGAASLALTKMLLFGTDAAYLAACAAWVALAGGGPQRLTVAGLALGGAAFTGVAALALRLVLHRSSLATSLAGALARLPSARLRRWILERGDRFEALDRTARAYFDAPLGARARCTGLFLLEWLTEGAETLLILALLGVPLSVPDALALDALGSLLRALAFFVPAGLGIQDAAQIFLLRAMGVPDPVATGAAFIFVKRSKEVFWIVAGASLLAGKRDLWRGASTERGA